MIARRDSKNLVAQLPAAACLGRSDRSHSLTSLASGEFLEPAMIEGVDALDLYGFF